MANQGPVDPQEILLQIELARVEMERERIALDRIHTKLENQRVHNERWNINVGAVQKNEMAASGSAVDMAKLTLRSAFLMNGGALIALPAFGQLVGSISKGYLVFALGAFVLGLVVTSIATLASYLSLHRNSSAQTQLANHRAMSLNNEELLIDENADVAKKTKVYEDLNKIEDKRVDHQKKASLFERFALSMAALAILLFVVGAGVGARMLVAPEVVQKEIVEGGGASNEPNVNGVDAGKPVHGAN